MGSAPFGTAAGVDEKPRPPMPPRRAKTAHVTLMSPDSTCRLPAGGKGGWKGRGVISVHRPIQAATRNADRGGRSLRSSSKPAASIATNIRKKGAAAPAPPAGRKREVGGGRGRAGCTGRTRLQGAMRQGASPVRVEEGVCWPAQWGLNHGSARNSCGLFYDPQSSPQRGCVRLVEGDSTEAL